MKKSTAEALQSPPGIHINQNTLPSTNKSTSTKNDNVCLTPGCIHAASHALDYIDDSIEPCDDFYSFSCGNFVKNTMIPDDKVAVNTFSLIHDKLQEQLRALIDAKIDPNDSQPNNLAKYLYKACMNKTLIEERGLKPLLNILERFGGWPVIEGDEWNDNGDWGWTWAIKQFRKVGYSMDYIFDFSIGIDLQKTVSRVIDVSVTLY